MELCNCAIKAVWSKDMLQVNNVFRNRLKCVQCMWYATHTTHFTHTHTPAGMPDPHLRHQRRQRAQPHKGLPHPAWCGPLCRSGTQGWHKHSALCLYCIGMAQAQCLTLVLHRDGTSTVLNACTAKGCTSTKHKSSTQCCSYCV
jgi:hypothetical protein